jgi:mono/diheme cytochrome c family protein
MISSKFFWMPMVAVALAGCSQPASNSGTEAAPPATFAASVQPIVAQRCAKCHVEESKGQYSLDSLESALAGGKNGAAVVVAGNGEGSLLYQMVAGTAEKRMPPKGEPLSAEDVATIKRWIDSGAH